MYLVIRLHRNNPPSERLSAFITDEGQNTVATIQEIEASSEDDIIIYAEPLRLGEEKGVSLTALWSLLAQGDGVKPGWLAIEQVALQAFLAGVAAERSQKVPIPVSVT